MIHTVDGISDEDWTAMSKAMRKPVVHITPSSAVMSSEPVMTPWKKWFAWYPVTTIGGQRVWFSWCYRRSIERTIDINQLIGSEESIEYGTIFDVMANPDS